MRLLYSLLINTVMPILHIVALFNKKMKLFVQGRTSVFSTLQEKITPTDKVIWFHAASLGEYEQGLPVMEKMRMLYPSHKILVTFFSPSGYEIRKNTTAADVVVYLPMDTLKNVKKFLKLARPEIAFFIKYEFWPNYLFELKNANVPTYLISGLFRPNQVFFKWYGSLYRKAFKSFNHFFVQYESSKQLISSIGFNNVTVSGDTRYDRVSRILEQDNHLPIIEEFKNGKTTVIFGSSWPKDEEMFMGFINKQPDNKFIIAPHTFGESHMQSLRLNITKPVVFFTEKEGKNLKDYDVLVIDTIGLLTKIYSYADVAYVGGGFGTSGLHNILEPAAYGIPVVIGPNHKKFPEAKQLADAGGCIVVHNETEIEAVLTRLTTDENYRNTTGRNAGDFVQRNRGAVHTIIKHIQDEHSL